MPEMASNRLYERSFESNRVVNFHLPEMASDFSVKKKKYCSLFHLFIDDKVQIYYNIIRNKEISRNRQEAGR